MRKILWLALFVLAVPGVSWAQTGPVVVYFNPSNMTVNVGQTFNVNIVADIPDPVVGWGLDVSFNSAVITQTGAAAIGPLWDPLPSLDGDDLAGIVPFPVPGELSGNGVVLATLTFKALAAGTSDLVASVTPGDLTEGFALAPPLFGFAPVEFQNGSVTVKSAGPPVGAPAISPLGLVILTGLLGLLGVGMRRRKG